MVQRQGHCLLRNHMLLLSYHLLMRFKCKAAECFKVLKVPHKHIPGLPMWLSGKEPACQCRRCGFNPWVRKIPWRRKWQATPIFLPWKSHGQRSLAGYSPWGHTEANMTERTQDRVCSSVPKTGSPSLSFILAEAPPGPSYSSSSQRQLTLLKGVQVTAKVGDPWGLFKVSLKSHWLQPRRRFHTCFHFLTHFFQDFLQWRKWSIDDFLCLSQHRKYQPGQMWGWFSFLVCRSCSVVGE